MINLLLRAWELIALIETCFYHVSIVFAKILGQPYPQLPAQLAGLSKSTSLVKHSFYQSSEFAFVELLEANCYPIASELERLNIKCFIALKEQFLHQKGWSTFSLYTHGLKNEENCCLCPETTRLIEKIPGLVTASFSILAPGTHITSHTRYLNGILRCHLGLVIPDQCNIQIGEEIQAWREGQCLIFDSTVEHELWNWSDSSRVVLLVDFKASEEHSLQQASWL